MQGKVFFGPDAEREVDDEFLSFICYQSEAEVLSDLLELYEVPLRSVTYGINQDTIVVAPDVLDYNPDGSITLTWLTQPVNWNVLINSYLIQIKQGLTTSNLATVGVTGFTITVLNTVGGAWNTVDPVSIVYYNNNYEMLPRMTKGYLLNMFITKSVFDILNEDFGQKSNVDGNNMLSQYEKKYYRLLSRLIAKDPKTRQFKHALLPDLAVNKGNWTGRQVVPKPGVSRNGCGPDNMKYAIRQNQTPAVGWMGAGFYGYGRNGQGGRGPC